MRQEHFIQQLAIERFKFHLAHLTAVLHLQAPDNTQKSNQDTQEPSDCLWLNHESATSLLRILSEDLSLLERSLEQKI